MEKKMKNSDAKNRTLIYAETRNNNVIVTKIEIYKINKSNRKNCQFWIFFLLILLLLALLAVLIAALFVAFINRKPGTFQMDCLKRSCAPGYGLKCINSTCLCPSNDYYYSTKCELKKSFGKFCNNYQDQCKQGLICFNGKCTCHKSQYWNGKICSNKVSYGENCENAECIDSLMLKCDPSTKQCICDTNRFWSGEACYVERTNNEKCKETNHCTKSQGLLCISGFCLCNSTFMYFDSHLLNCIKKKNESELCSQNIQCFGDMVCNSIGLCKCSNAITHYFDYITLTCSFKTFNNTRCSETRSCRNDLGLTCLNGLCQCSSPLFWYSGQCSFPLSYNIMGCTDNSHCQSTLGLICNGYPSITNCNCPITSSIGMCDCPEDKYWNGIQCVFRSNVFQTCNSAITYQCLRNLTCDSCSSTCVSSSLCMTGWEPYSGKCYKIIYRDIYANLMSYCYAQNPLKKSQFALVESSTALDYFNCKFTIVNFRAYVNSSSSISCPLASSSFGPCYSILAANFCESHSCVCGVIHDALCEYTI